MIMKDTRRYDNSDGILPIVVYGIRMYSSKQRLDQRPRALINHAGVCFSAAHVAAPIRKLCDEYAALSHELGSNDFTTSENICCVKYAP